MVHPLCDQIDLSNQKPNNHLFLSQKNLCDMILIVSLLRAYEIRELGCQKGNVNFDDKNAKYLK